jgi:hypothetical protein
VLLGQKSHTSWGGDRLAWNNGGIILTGFRIYLCSCVQRTVTSTPGILTGENPELVEKSVPVSLFPPTFPHEMNRAQTRVSAVKGQ